MRPNPIIRVVTAAGLFELQEGAGYTVEELRESIAGEHGVWCDSGPGFVGRRQVYFNLAQVVAFYPEHA